MTATLTPAAVIVRRATEADLEAIVRMGVAFHANSPYADLFVLDRDRCTLTVDWLLAHGAIFMAEKDGTPVGMFGIAVSPHLMAAELFATEIFWWVEPGARGLGLKLLRDAEAWAKEQGATVLQLIAPSERVGRLYERLGFRLIERAYSRAVE